MAFLTKCGSDQKKLKNLGWLVRNWTEVARFEVCDPEATWRKVPGVTGTGYEGRVDVCPAEGGKCCLIAWLKCGGCYATHFADISVCRSWLNRPVFITLPVKWFTVDLIIGETLKKG
jgi:hypothetical protein